MCQSSYNTLGDFHHVCFEVRNDKRGRGRISVRFLFPFLRGLASSVLVSPKNGKTCTASAVPHFFFFFHFSIIYTQEFTQVTQIAVTIRVLTYHIFLSLTGRNWISKSIKCIRGLFPPSTPGYEGFFFLRSGCCRRLSFAELSIHCDDGADKRAAPRI